MKFSRSTYCLTVLMILAFPGSSLLGQEVPAKPFSIPVYNPMILNPAYAGSKDYTHIGLTTRALKSPDSQVLNFHKRFSRPTGGFSPMGIGAYFFQEQYNNSWNTGLALTGAYHINLDKDHLHNLALGITAKGILAIPKTGGEAIPDSLGAKFNPNMDAGIYYYGPSAFAGISSTMLFKNKSLEDSTLYYSHFNREYHLYGGYKFLVDKKHGIVIEPSILLSLTDDTFSEAHKHIVPYLKVYLENFYVGTYLKDFDVFALFFQYQFPRFYTGVFLEFPRIGYLNDDNIIFELSLGVNLGSEGSSFMNHRHW